MNYPPQPRTRLYNTYNNAREKTLKLSCFAENRVYLTGIHVTSPRQAQRQRKQTQHLAAHCFQTQVHGASTFSGHITPANWSSWPSYPQQLSRTRRSVLLCHPQRYHLRFLAYPGFLFHAPRCRLASSMR